jgi:hypothetical protein
VILIGVEDEVLVVQADVRLPDARPRRNHWAMGARESLKVLVAP